MVHDPETLPANLQPLIHQREVDQAAIDAFPDVRPGAFAELIALRLKAQGITPRELERRSGDTITDTTWAAYLKGNLPRRSTIPAIALALGVPFRELFVLIEAQRQAFQAGIRINTIEEAQAWVDKHAAETTAAGGA